MEEGKEKKGSKSLIIFLIIFLLIVLGGSFFFIYQMVYIKGNNNFLNVYKMNDGTICLVNDISDSCSELAFSIKTDSSDARIIAVDANNLFVLYQDNGLKLYNINLQEFNSIDLEDTYTNYEIYLNNDQDSVNGIVYTTSSNKVGYYNVSINQKLYVDLYDEIRQIDDNYLNASDSSKTYLLNANNESEELIYEKIDENDQMVYYQTLSYQDKYYFLEYSNETNNINKIYSNDKNILFQFSLPSSFVSFYEGNLYVVDSNTIKKYDMDANLISTSDSYDEIQGLIRNYLVYITDNKLSLLNNDTSEVVTILNWNDTYSYNGLKSGYYLKEELKASLGLDIEDGIYLFIEYSELDKNGKSGIIYCYTNNQEIKTYDLPLE